MSEDNIDTSLLANGRTMRRFRLRRKEDETGVSGVGFIAEGMQFSDGTCVIKWLTATSSMGIYHSAVEMIHVHGHGGKTVIEWLDENEDPTKLLDEKPPKDKKVSTKTKK